MVVASCITSSFSLSLARFAFDVSVLFHFCKAADTQIHSHTRYRCIQHYNANRYTVTMIHTEREDKIQFKAVETNVIFYVFGWLCYNLLFENHKRLLAQNQHDKSMKIDSETESEIYIYIYSKHEVTCTHLLSNMVSFEHCQFVCPTFYRYRYNRKIEIKIRCDCCKRFEHFVRLSKAFIESLFSSVISSFLLYHNQNDIRLFYRAQSFNCFN